MGWTILGCIIAIIIDVIIADEMKAIAERKGHQNPGRYFWFSFLLGLPGWIMVAALPDNRSIALLEKLVNQTPVTEAPAPAPKTDAPVQMNVPVPAPASAPAAAPVSVEPQAPIIVEDDPSQIRCPACGLVQKSNRLVCWKCGAKFTKE